MVIIGIYIVIDMNEYLIRLDKIYGSKMELYNHLDQYKNNTASLDVTIMNRVVAFNDSVYYIMPCKNTLCKYNESGEDVITLTD